MYLIFAHPYFVQAEKKAAEAAAAAVASVRGTSNVKSSSKMAAPDTKSAAYQAVR